MGSFDARAVANYVLDLAEAEARQITHLHLQKILYNAHGYHLALYGEPLFYQEVQAWKNGPVIPAVYQEFRECGRQPIRARALDLITSTGLVEPYRADFDEDTRRFLSAIWDGHKDVSAVRLSAISHMAGSPWHKVASGKDLGLHRGLRIPNELIREYFARITAGWEQR